VYADDVLAAGLAPSGAGDGEPGSMAGNSPVALPPGLSVGIGAATPTGASPGSEALIPIGLAGARMVMAADASGAVCRLAAPPIAVRLAEVTVVAVSGTVSSAWSCRWAEPAFTAPRSHEAVPSALPQPKLKCGVPAPAGFACSRIVASGTVPPVAQAYTAHWVACPRSPLCCRGSTSTHRLTCAVAAAAPALAMAAVKTMAPRAAALAVDVGVAVAGVGVGVVGVGVGVAVVGVGVGVVGVGVGVVGVGVGVAVVPVGVGVGVAVVGVGDGVGVAVFLAVGLGDAAAACSGSHDSPLAPAVLARAVLAADATLPTLAATMPNEITVSRTLPAATVTTGRRARAKRI
jgi:hypothetical protein